MDRQKAFCVIVLALSLLCAAGCDPPASSSDQRREFDKIVADPPAVDPNEVANADTPRGPYRLVRGDLLQVQMPQALRAVFPNAPSVFDIKPMSCRVSDSGEIVLPTVGALKVAGLTLTQAESAIENAYYPKFMAERPTIVAQVAEYWSAKVWIVGAVDKPGVYDLHSDEMSLAAALMKAGGIIKEGSGIIRVWPPGEEADTHKEIVLPVSGGNIPAVNMALSGGETITVERMTEQNYTVVGLVKKPGIFPYPPYAKYNLMQAIGSAGGMDDAAEPDFLRICRADGSGKCTNVIIKVAGEDMTKTSSIAIQPGDAVYVEQTPSTRTRQTVRAILEHLGMYLGASGHAW